jgi:hypothetical protein
MQAVSISVEEENTNEEELGERLPDSCQCLRLRAGSDARNGFS